MSDPLDDRPEADPGRSRRARAFLWTFGTCAGLPFLAAAATVVAPSLEIGFIVMVVGAPVLWLGAFVLGIGMWMAGSDRSAGVLLGALAGAIAGFSLCSGVLSGANSLGL